MASKLLLASKNALSRSVNRYLALIMQRSHFLDLEKEILIVNDPLKGVLEKYVEEEATDFPPPNHFPESEETCAVAPEYLDGFQKILETQWTGSVDDILSVVRQLNTRINIIREMTFKTYHTNLEHDFQVTISSNSMESSPIPFHTFRNDFLYAYKLEVRNIIDREVPLRLVGIKKESHD